MFHSLRSHPFLVFAAILTLALATGVNLAMVSLVDRALLSAPAHVRDPTALYTVGFAVPGERATTAMMTTSSYVTYDVIRTQVSSLSGVAAWQRTSTGVLIGSDQLPATAMMVSGNYFDVLGASPRIGRTIQPADDRAGEAVAVVGHTFWQTALSGDAAGTWPTSEHRRPRLPDCRRHAQRIQRALQPERRRLGPGQRRHAAVARLESESISERGFGGRQARGRSDAASRRRADRRGPRSRGVARSAPGRGSGIRRTSRSSTGSLASRLLVFVIGIANASTLLLVRGSRRRREVAIRTALGATRARLCVEAFVESALVSIVAASASMLLSWWFQSAIAPPCCPPWPERPSATIVTILAAAIAASVTAISTSCATFVQLVGRALDRCV